MSNFLTVIPPEAQYVINGIFFLNFTRKHKITFKSYLEIKYLIKGLSASASLLLETADRFIKNSHNMRLF